LPVREYTAVELRAALRRFHGAELRLDSVVRLAADSAEALSEHEAFHLSLGGMKMLTPDVAEVLARRGRSLDLSGLKTMSEEVAVALSKHSGWLRLDGLESLSLEAAASLARHEHSLSLRGLECLPDDVAMALAGYTGLLTVSDQMRLTETARAQLMRGKGSVRFT
jgi:hypothetical protein